MSVISHLIVTADSGPEFAGRLVGAALIPMGLLLGTLKCGAIMRRPTTSGWCVCSLLLFLIAMFGLTALSAAGQFLHWSRVVFAMWAPIFTLLIAASVIVGIVGLVKYDGHGFRQGRNQAIWSLVLSSLMTVTLFIAIAVNVAKRASGARSTIPGKREELADINCALTPPPGWMKIDTKTLGAKDSPAGYRLFRPEMYMLLVPEESGDLVSHAEYMKMVKKQVEGNGEVREEAEDVVPLPSATFRRMTVVIRLKTMNSDLYYERWIAKEGSMFWQLVVWGSPASRGEIQAEARKFAEKFQVLDRTRVGTLAGNLQDVSKPTLGFSTHLAGSGWNAGGPVMQRTELVSFSAKRVYEGLVVAPLRFQDPAPDLEALTRGLITVLGFEYPLPDEAVTKPFVSPLGEGTEIATEREVEGKRYSYILRIVRGDRSGHLIAGWALLPGGKLDMVRRALDKIELRPPSGDPPSLSPGQKSALKTVLNQAALSLFTRKDYEGAALWFRHAFEQTKEDPTLLENVATALESDGRSKEAMEYLEAHAWRFPRAVRMQTHRAILLARNGDPDAGNAQFLKLVENGVKDEAVMREWLRQLIDQNRQDLAEKAVNAWIARQPSIKASEWQADIFLEEGDSERAVKAMEKLVADNPGDDAVLSKFGEILNLSKDYGRAGEIASKLLDKGKESPRVLQILGWSQMGRKWYRDARGTFERVARLRPDDAQVKDAIRIASAAIGQGNNSDLNHPIDPVPVPPEIAAELKSEEAAPPKSDGEPAVVLSRSTGYDFEKGKPLRYTLRRKIKVLDQAGVNAYSTLEFPFDPVAERIFVNRLAVSDASGKPIANGSLDDAFVRDLEENAASNQKMLQVQAPGLKPGATIDVEVTVEDRSAQSDFPFKRHLFAYLLPCAAEAVFVTGDTSRVKAITAQNHDIKTVKKDGLIAWIVRGQAAMHNEPLSIPLERHAPMLWLSGGAGDWSNVAKEYLAQINDRLQPDSAVTKTATEVCRGIKDPREKIAALARRVQSDVSYKAIEFGVRARRPNAAGDTLRQRFGDCKDHALLLYQFLRAAGVEASLALVNTNRHVQAALPSLDQFNHMVVYVPALGNGWLIDATDKFLAAGSLPGNGLWESQALVLDSAKPRLILPQSPPARDSADVESRRTITPFGNDWQVEESLTLTGYYASSMRLAFSGQPPASQTRRIQELLASVGAAEIKDFRFENLDDLAQPARLAMTYVVRNANKTGAGKVSGALPALWERYYLTQTFVPDRATPFIFRYPFHFASDVTVKIPPATSFAGMAHKEAGKFAEWEMHPGPASTEGSNVRFDFRAHPGEFPADQYAKFYEAWDSARRTWDSAIEWPAR